jgi:hypothetical protein
MPINSNRSPSFLGFFLSIAFCLLFLVACGPKTPPRTALPEGQAADVLREVRAFLQSWEAVGSARGYARVQLHARRKTLRTDEALFIHLPDAFRFESLDDFGRTRFLLLSDGQNLQWRDFDRGESEIRERNEEELKRFLPMASSIEETLGLFLGKLPPPDLAGAQVFKEGDSSRFRVVFPSGEFLWDEGEGAIVSFALKGERGRVVFQYEGGEFKELNLPSLGKTLSRIKVPSRVKMKDFKTKNRVEIHYLSLEINPKLAPSLFEMNSNRETRRLDD